MSEYTTTIMVCDRCYPDFLPSFSFFPLESVKGVFRGGENAAMQLGWGVTDYGHACPDCVALEAEESGDGEVVLGQAALDSISGGEEDDA